MDIKRIFSLLALCLGVKSMANQPLMFPATLNNAQTLPQRFEYRLLDNDKIQIGDMLFDAKYLNFKISQGSKFLFTWPYVLLAKGDLVIKDNVGKTIWSTKISSKQIKVFNSKEAAYPNLRNYIGLYNFSSKEVPNVINKLKGYPFFRFCAQINEDLSHIQLCSKEQFIKTEGKKFTVYSRDTLLDEAFVEINGKSVGPQGVILLNDTSDTVAFRGVLKSGAALEIDARMKKVEYADIKLSEDGKTLLVKAHGSEPADPRLVLRREKKDWVAQVPADRPTMYIKGEGEIPLKQEFYDKGTTMDPHLEITIQDPAPSRTMRSSITLHLKKNAEAQMIKNDDSTDLIEKDSSTVDWTLRDLDNNKLNRRLIKVKDGDKEYIAAYDIYKLPSFEVYARGAFPLDAQAGLSWNYNEYFGIFADGEQEFSHGTKSDNFQQTNIGLRQYSPLKSQIFKGLGMELFYSFLNYQLVQSSGPSIGFYLPTVQGPSWFNNYFNASEIKLRLPVSSTGNNGSVKFSSFDLDYELKHNMQENFYWDLGTQYQYYQLNAPQGDGTTAPASPSRFKIFAGLGYLF